MHLANLFSAVDHVHIEKTEPSPIPEIDPQGSGQQGHPGQRGQGRTQQAKVTASPSPRPGSGSQGHGHTKVNGSILHGRDPVYNFHRKEKRRVSTQGQVLKVTKLTGHDPLCANRVLPNSWFALMTVVASSNQNARFPAIHPCCLCTERLAIFSVAPRWREQVAAR